MIANITFLDLRLWTSWETSVLHNYDSFWAWLFAGEQEHAVVTLNMDF